MKLCIAMRDLHTMAIITQLTHLPFRLGRARAPFHCSLHDATRLNPDAARMMMTFVDHQLWSTPRNQTPHLTG